LALDVSARYCFKLPPFIGVFDRLVIRARGMEGGHGVLFLLCETFPEFVLAWAYTVGRHHLGTCFSMYNYELSFDRPKGKGPSWVCGSWITESVIVQVLGLWAKPVGMGFQKDGKIYVAWLLG
jgi:hypothetical protein